MEQAIIKAVEKLVAPILEGEGLELIEIQYRRENRGWVLRLFIDKEGGVTLDDCQRVSEELSAVLDVEDLIEHSYILEVSSPGLDRPLRREGDFERFKGKRVRISLKEVREGRRHLEGYLLGLREGMVGLDVEGRVIEIPFASIKRANLKYEF